LHFPARRTTRPGRLPLKSWRRWKQAIRCIQSASVPPSGKTLSGKTSTYHGAARERLSKEILGVGRVLGTQGTAAGSAGRPRRVLAGRISPRCHPLSQSNLSRPTVLIGPDCRGDAFSIYRDRYRNRDRLRSSISIATPIPIPTAKILHTVTVQISRRDSARRVGS
jgi:hypothetical protein